MKMKLNEIVLEAPDFGGGRVAEDRPINMAELSDKTSSDVIVLDEVLKNFSVRLRKDMLEIAMNTGKRRARFVEELKLAAEDVCASDLVVKASAFLSNPKDAGKLAKLTQSMVSTSIFLASIRRV
ncbi:hypothetical protein [Lentilitoribacter sp. Alg239-R112]|uniref:hypothetical protein n=1 Tax=Lentilitoribacter sp. Alg239-R112 TaxID=2305987 RepID=UPI0013A6B9C2|nr:hypothetical protein [Lentilitoribacter sp. Alg239-R112]